MDYNYEEYYCPKCLRYYNRNDYDEKEFFRLKLGLSKFNCHPGVALLPSRWEEEWEIERELKEGKLRVSKSLDKMFEKVETKRKVKMEKLRYRRCEIFIKCGDGNKKVRAYELVSFPKGLVAHKRRGGDEWVITHKPSGLLISRCSFDTLREALWKIKKLYELSSKEGFDWNDSDERLRKVRSLETKVEEVLKRKEEE